MEARERALAVKKTQAALKEETKVIRVPISLVDSLIPTIEVYKSQVKSKVEVFLTKDNPTELSIPIFYLSSTSRISISSR